MREAPSGSELPTFFRWCLGGMAAMASGSASRSAFACDAHARVHERVLRVTRQTEVECGDISAAQEELLARAPLLGGDGASAPDADAVAVDADAVAVDADAVDSDSDERVLRLLTEHTVKAGGISASQEDLLARAPLLGGNGEEAEAEAEVFSTPPAQDEQSPPQQSQGEKGEAVINMCTQSFTQLSPSPASSSPSVSKKRRLIRTPTPSPSPSPPPSSYVHPLYNAFVMIPSAPLPPADGDFLELALKHGIF